MTATTLTHSLAHSLGVLRFRVPPACAVPTGHLRDRSQVLSRLVADMREHNISFFYDGQRQMLPVLEVDIGACERKLREIRNQQTDVRV